MTAPPRRACVLLSLLGLLLSVVLAHLPSSPSPSPSSASPELQTAELLSQVDPRPPPAPHPHPEVTWTSRSLPSHRSSSSDHQGQPDTAVSSHWPPEKAALDSQAGGSSSRNQDLKTPEVALVDLPPVHSQSQQSLTASSPELSPSHIEPHQSTSLQTNTMKAPSTQRIPDQNGLVKKSQRKLKLRQGDAKIVNALEKIFLQNAGLQTRPRISAEFSVPEYMLDLYRTQSQAAGGPRNHFVGAQGTGIIAANTVRSFLHQESESPSCRPPNCVRLTFDLSTLPERETLAGAELRVFTDVAGSPEGGAMDVPRGRDGAGVTHRLEVHEIMQPRSKDGDVISRLLDTRTVNAENATWESFDVHPAVLRWKKDPSRNHGLELKLVARQRRGQGRESGTRSSLSMSSHVRLRRSVELSASTWSLQRPLLVTFTNDGSSPPSSSSSSSRPGATRLRRSRRSSSGSGGDTSASGSKKNRRKNRKRRRKKKKKKRRRKNKGNKNMCKRHGLYVNFSDVGWDDWIVAPPGYNAYYCHGDCMAPLPYFSKASNHAMLQARVYKVNPSAVPMVCCVPVRMSPISLLYMDEKGRTILKNYQDMRVEECGCK